jgi:hypothetical protein
VVDPKPIAIDDVVSKYALPELTYKFLASGTATLAAVYVTEVGVWKPVADEPVTRVDDPELTARGYVSPLSRATLPLMVNVAELVKCGMVLEYITVLLFNAMLVLLNVGVPGVELS